MWKPRPWLALHRFLLMRGVTSPFHSLSQAKLEELASEASERNFTLQDWKDHLPRAEAGRGSAPAFASKLLSQLNNPQSARTLLNFMESENAASLYVKARFVGLLGFKPEFCIPEDLRFIKSVCDESLEKLPVLADEVLQSLMSGIKLLPYWKELGYKLLKKTNSRNLATAYSEFAVAAFHNNDFEFGFNLINELTPLGDTPTGHVYDSILNHLLKMSDCESRDTLMIQMFHSLKTTGYRPSERVVKRLVDFCEEHCETWEARFTNITDRSKCSSCLRVLTPQSLTDEEYVILKENLDKYYLSASSLTVHTNKDEVLRFKHFLKNVQPYTMVIDALNVVYAVRSPGIVKALCDELTDRGEKLLIIGRKHLLLKGGIAVSARTPEGPPRPIMGRDFIEIFQKYPWFMVHNRSADDAFLLYAALYNHDGACVVSNDCLNTHLDAYDKFGKRLFSKWRTYHHAFYNRSTGSVIYPSSVGVCDITEGGSVIHLPYLPSKQYEYGSSKLCHWVCFQRVGKERKKVAESEFLPREAF